MYICLQITVIMKCKNLLDWSFKEWVPWLQFIGKILFYKATLMICLKFWASFIDTGFSSLSKTPAFLDKNTC